MSFFESLKEVTQIIVHDGRFHCDEVLAVSLLRYCGCAAPVVRSREFSAENCPDGSLLVDVGELYDGVRFFDHHQPGAPVRTEYYTAEEALERTPFSAAGLIWQALGRELAGLFFSAPDEQERFFTAIDRKLIMPTDFQDNGAGGAAAFRGITLTDLVASNNSDDLGNSAKQDRCFEATVQAVSFLIEGYIDSAASSIRGEQAIRQCIDEALQLGRKYVFLKPGVCGPWRNLLQQDGALWNRTKKIRAFVYENNGGEGYYISMMPLSRTERFSVRYRLTEKLRKEFPEFLFIHVNGFLGLVKNLDRLDEILERLERCREE